jgi:dipeptide transport system substrate-binding protein
VINRKKIVQFAVCSTLLGSLTVVQASSVLNVCLSNAPDTFDIVQSANLYTQNGIGIPLMDSLVDFKPGTTQLMPSLAERWDISKDGLSYTFYLRKNVSFHNNWGFKPTRFMNADDVLWSFNRMWDKKHPWNKFTTLGFQYFQGMGLDQLIQSIQKIDDHTVKFTLREPDVTFLANVAHRSMGAIFSKEYADYLDKNNRRNDWNTKPIGTGPFILKRYDKDAVIRYEANKSHWERAPKIDKMNMVITKDLQVAYQKVRKGECHVTDDVKAEMHQSIKADKSVDFISYPLETISFFALNTQKPHLKDKRVRQALWMAFNRKSYFDAMYQGGDAAEVAVNPFPKTVLGFDSSIKDYPYDLARAKQLLKEAGYPNGFTMRYYTTEHGRISGRKQSELIQADWAKIGVKVEPVFLEFGELMKRRRSGEHDMVGYSWGTDNGDPDNFLRPNLSCQAKKEGQNAAFWCHPEFDVLLKQGVRESNSTKRAAIYQKALKIFHDQAPWIPLAYPKGAFVKVKNLKGVVPNPMHEFDYSSAYFTK